LQSTKDVDVHRMQLLGEMKGCAHYQNVQLNWSLYSDNQQFTTLWNWNFPQEPHSIPKHDRTRSTSTQMLEANRTTSSFIIPPTGRLMLPFQSPVHWMQSLCTTWLMSVDTYIGLVIPTSKQQLDNVANSIMFAIYDGLQAAHRFEA
jgi:hypothetical protein